MFMGENGTPITISTGYDGVMKALFAHVVPCTGTSHGYAESALAHNVLSTGHQKVTRQSDQEPCIIDVKHKAGTNTPQSKTCTKRAQSETATPTAASSEQSHPSKDSFAPSRTSQNDRLVRPSSLDCSVLKCLVRHAAQDLGDVSCRQRRHDSSSTHPRQGVQSTGCSGRRANPLQNSQDCGATAETRCELVGRMWLGFNTRTGEYVVSNKAAVVMCRCIQRRNKEERWNRAILWGARESLECARRQRGS